MKGRPTQKTTHPNKSGLRKQFQDSLYKLSPFFPLKQAENRQKSLWVGGFWGGSIESSLETLDRKQSREPSINPS